LAKTPPATATMPLLDSLDEKVKDESKQTTANLTLIDIASEADESSTSQPEEFVPLNVDLQQSKSQAQRAAFDDFLKSEEGHIRGTEATQAEVERKAAEESARIIDRAREYQQELFERAKEENVIAVYDLILLPPIPTNLSLDLILEAARRLLPAYLSNMYSYRRILDANKVVSQDLPSSLRIAYTWSDNKLKYLPATLLQPLSF
jgi:hypothetical protein